MSNGGPAPIWPPKGGNANITKIAGTAITVSDGVDTYTFTTDIETAAKFSEGKACKVYLAECHK